MIDYNVIARNVVSLGAAVLDRLLPDWVEKMPEDETMIDFLEPDACPLHWAYGDFLEGDRVLWRNGPRRLDVVGFAYPDKFVHLPSSEVPSALKAVNRAWHELIRSRRSS